MHRLVGRLRALHGGQLCIVLGILAMIGFSMGYLRASFADQSHQRVAEYFAPIQARTEAQAAIARAGGSVAEINAATAGMPQQNGVFPGFARTENEESVMLVLDIAIIVLVILAVAISWTWLGARR